MSKQYECACRGVTKRRSDLDRAMDTWRAKDAYQAQTLVGVLAVIALLAGMIVGSAMLKTWFGM